MCFLLDDVVVVKKDNKNGKYLFISRTVDQDALTVVQGIDRQNGANFLHRLAF